MKIKELVFAFLFLISSYLPICAQDLVQPVRDGTYADELTIEISDGGISFIHFYCYVPEIGSFKDLGTFWLDDNWGTNKVTIDLNKVRDSYQPVFITGNYFFDLVTVNFETVFSPRFYVQTDNCTISIRPNELSKMVLTNGVVPLRWDHFSRFGQEPEFDVCVRYKSLSCSNRSDFNPSEGEPIYGNSIDWVVPHDVPRVATYTYRISQHGRPWNFVEDTFSVDTNATIPVTLTVDQDSSPSDTGYFWLDMYTRNANGAIMLQKPPRFWVLEYADVSFSQSTNIVWHPLSDSLPTGSYKIGVPKWYSGFMFRAKEYSSSYYFPSQ